MGVAELALHHPKHILHATSNRGHLLIAPLPPAPQSAFRMSFERHAPVNRRLAGGLLDTFVHLGGITEQRTVVLPQRVQHFG